MSLSTSANRKDVQRDVAFWHVFKEDVELLVVNLMAQVADLIDETKIGLSQGTIGVTMYENGCMFVSSCAN